MAKITLTLTGYLGEILPTFQTDAKTMREAISALSEKLRGLSRENYHQISIGGFNTKTLLEMDIYDDLEVYVYPVFSGGSSVARIIVGIIIIVVAFVLQYLTAGASTPYTSYLVSAGLGLILGGVISLLIKPQSVEPRNGTISKVGDNLLLTGDQNTTKIGTRIPVIYGKRRWFGQIISANTSSKYRNAGGGGGENFPFKTGDDTDGQSPIQGVNPTPPKKYKDAYVFKPLYQLQNLEGGKYSAKKFTNYCFNKTPDWPDLSIVYFSTDIADKTFRISTYGDRGELLQSREYPHFNMTSQAGYNKWVRLGTWLMLNIGNASAPSPYVIAIDLTAPDRGVQIFNIGGFEAGITAIGKLGETGDSRYIFVHPWLGLQGKYSDFYYRVDTQTGGVKLFPVPATTTYYNWISGMGEGFVLGDSNNNLMIYDADWKQIGLIDKYTGFPTDPDRDSFIQIFGTLGRVFRWDYHKTTFEPIIYTVCQINLKTGKLIPDLEYLRQDTNVTLTNTGENRFFISPQYDPKFHMGTFGTLRKTKVEIV